MAGVAKRNKVIGFIAAAPTAEDYVVYLQLAVFVLALAALTFVAVTVENHCFCVLKSVVSAFLIAPVTDFFVCKSRVLYQMRVKLPCFDDCCGYRQYGLDEFDLPGMALYLTYYSRRKPISSDTVFAIQEARFAIPRLAVAPCPAILGSLCHLVCNVVPYGYL